MLATSSPQANNPPQDPPPPAMAGGEPLTRVKRSMPSLIGGVFTGIVVFVLWLLLFGTESISLVMLGAIVATTLGIWIRLADL